jgi:nucleoside-diphosphate-sugar epimerase
MRVFLAGATGVVGRRLTPLLVDQGHQVTCLVRRDVDAAAMRAVGADAAIADVFDAEALARAVKSAAPEVVVHQLTDLRAGSLAANADIRRTGTRNLVNAALAAGARRIVAQSIAWAYRAGEEPATERTPLDVDADEPRRSTVGGVAALEAAVRELPEWVVLRYGLLYGPGTWYAPEGLMADRARRGELAATADVASFVHVEDAVAAAAAALGWPPGAVNVCDDEPAAGHEWVPAFARWVGAPAPPVDTETPRPGWARGADNRYARRELGWTPAYRSWRAEFGGSAGSAG